MKVYVVTKSIDLNDCYETVCKFDKAFATLQEAEQYIKSKPGVCKSKQFDKPNHSVIGGGAGPNTIEDYWNGYHIIHYPIN